MHHESGVRHKMNVEAHAKEKQKEKLYGARNDSELRQTLAQIERAARQAMSGSESALPATVSDN